MIHIDIIAISCIKKGPYHDLISDYSRRIQWPHTLYEYESKHRNPLKSQNDENEKILARIRPDSLVIALDERGKTYSSRKFTALLEDTVANGIPRIQFIIGGADGLQDAVREKADKLLSFGEQTWPHAMVRVMLLEQIYRAQQIVSGHPYHRD